MYYKNDEGKDFFKLRKIDPRVSGQFLHFNLKVTPKDDKYTFEYTLQGLHGGNVTVAAVEVDAQDAGWSSVHIGNHEQIQNKIHGFVRNIVVRKPIKI